MVPVVVVVGGGYVLFELLNFIVAQSHRNNLGRSSKVRTSFPLCDQPVSRKPPKKI